MPTERKKKTYFYFDLDGMDIEWHSKKEILEFDKLWNEGTTLQQLMEHFNRDADQIAIHVIDRARRGYIIPRKNGILGG